MSKPIIICVDDEKIIVDSLKTEIRSAFREQLSVETAESAEEALEIIGNYMQDSIDIPIVISDYLMPGTKGDELLAKVHLLLPETKKILLTGQVTTSGLGNAINDAKLYRFIPKPWQPEDLDLTITEAFKSYYNKLQLDNAFQKVKEMNMQLEERIKQRTAELEESNKRNQLILEQTLFGSINALIKILMKSNPEVFDRAFRVRVYAKRILKHLKIKNIWEIEIASLFSQLGCIDLPENLLNKVIRNEKLTQQEINVYKLHPQKTYDLISTIPVFGNIANGILNQLKPVHLLSNNESYMISSILKIAGDFDDLVRNGKTEAEAIEMMKKNYSLYDKNVLNALIRDVYDNELMNFPNKNNILRLNIRELKAGYVLAQDISDTRFNVIYRAEEELTKEIISELIGISKNREIREPILVYNFLYV